MKGAVPRWTARPDVVARPLGDVIVLVSLGTNQIYELNRTGARMWELSAAGLSRDEIVGAVAAEFAQELTEVAAGFDALEVELSGAALIDVADDR